MKNIKKIPLIFSILSILTFFTPANAEIKVVASIKPIHSLASYLMDGIAKPDLIVDGYASPHGFAMKPSHAKMLQNADLIFWVGEDLESFLEKPLSSIAKKAEKIELMETKGLQVLKFRERNIFDEHDHDDHGHDDHGKKEDDHDDHGHDHDDHGKKEDDHDQYFDILGAFTVNGHETTVKKKMIMTTITTIMVKRKTIMTTTDMMMTTVKKKMIMTTITTIMVKRKTIMTTTDMMIMMDMLMVNLIHTFGWTQLMQKLC